MKLVQTYSCPKFASALFICVLMGFSFTNAIGQTIIANSKTTIASPDKNIVLNFYQKQINDSIKRMFYSVSYKNKPVVLESALDLQLDNHLSEQAMALKMDKHKIGAKIFRLPPSKHQQKILLGRPFAASKKKSAIIIMLPRLNW